NGTAINGATGATINLLNLTTADAGSYDVVVTISAGSVTSSAATLSSIASLPAITSQPVNQTATSGGSATFSITATGNPAPSYQWRRNGVPLNLNGSWTTSTLSVSNVTSTDIGNYDVIVTNSAGSIISSSAS